MGEVYYKEALPDAIRRYKADTVILSIYLPGAEDIRDTIFKARMADVRVIFLVGDTSRTDETILDSIAMGVYDILFGSIRLSDVEEAVKKPATFREIIKEVRYPGKPEGR
ncbi:MAG: hypothetical protein ACPLRZ_11670, partial [Thermovenabulum sp.]